MRGFELVGNVRVEQTGASTRAIRAAVLDYDRATQRVALSGRDRSPVLLTQDGRSQEADSVSWDLAKNRLTLQSRGGGTVPLQ